MRKFVLPDIFGITTELQEFCALLQGDIEILNPYSQKELDFEAESDAYRYFNNATNLVRYTQLLRDKITKNDNPVLLLKPQPGGYRNIGWIILKRL